MEGDGLRRLDESLVSLSASAKPGPCNVCTQTVECGVQRFPMPVSAGLTSMYPASPREESQRVMKAGVYLQAATGGAGLCELLHQEALGEPVIRPRHRPSPIYCIRLIAIHQSRRCAWIQRLDAKTVGDGSGPMRSQ